MNRDAAIEAGARALLHDETNGLCDLGRVCELCDCFADRDGGKMRDGYARGRAAMVIDAAAPHLVGEPVGWAVIFDKPNPLFDDEGVVYRHRDQLDRDHPSGKAGVQRCGLVPVEDQP